MPVSGIKVCHRSAFQIKRRLGQLYGPQLIEQAQPGHIEIPPHIITLTNQIGARHNLTQFPAGFTALLDCHSLQVLLPDQGVDDGHKT